MSGFRVFPLSKEATQERIRELKTRRLYNHYIGKNTAARLDFVFKMSRRFSNNVASNSYILSTPGIYTYQRAIQIHTFLVIILYWAQSIWARCHVRFGLVIDFGLL